MIDLKKTYKTAGGQEVRLAFIEDGFIYGFVKSIEYTWSPCIWDIDGIPNNDRNDLSLVEKPPFIDVSLEIIVLEGGAIYTSKEFDIWRCMKERDYKVFARFWVNQRVEEGDGMEVKENENV